MRVVSSLVPVAHETQASARHTLALKVLVLERRPPDVAAGRAHARQAKVDDGAVEARGLVERAVGRGLGAGRLDEDLAEVQVAVLR